MARWITIKESAVPFDYKWPTATAITAFTAGGEHFVKDEVADFAIGKGYATEGKAKGSTTKSTKGKTTRRKARNTNANAKTPDNGSDDRVDAAHLAQDDRADDRGALDQASE